MESGLSPARRPASSPGTPIAVTASLVDRADGRVAVGAAIGAAARPGYCCGWGGPMPIGA